MVAKLKTVQVDFDGSASSALIPPPGADELRDQNAG